MQPRDFFAYHWAIQRRASRQTVRFALKHLRAETAVAVAGAATTWFVAPDPDPLVALYGGVLTGVILFAVYYCCYLLVAPAEMHVEQENQIAQYVPVEAPRSYKGSIDFSYDIEKNISAGRLQAVTEQIGKEANRISTQLEAAIDVFQKNVSVAKQRRVAIKLGREIQAGARRYRRLHKKYKAVAVAFGETFEGATPLYVAKSPPDDVQGALQGAIYARDATERLQVITRDTRWNMMESLSGRQEQISIGIEQLNFVMEDIEKTAGEIVETFNKIINMLRARSK